MTSIGIIGAGISGLHLALFLQQHGVHSTLYVDKTPQQMREGRILNNVCRFGRVREQERILGVDHWDFDDYGMYCANVHVHDESPISFRGYLSNPASFVDFRLYLPKLLTDYMKRGGEVAQIGDEKTVLDRTADKHDLTVIAAGGRQFAGLFPRDAQRSAERPQRAILAGLFHGVKQAEPMGLHFDIVPGAGEIFQNPVYSHPGRVSGITFESIPGGPWHAAVEEKYYEDPQRCADVVLALLEQAESTILDRVDRSTFALTGPLDLLQGALTPTVRRPWLRHTDNHYVLAVGDGAVLNDPVTGQGGNLAATSAWALGQAILDAGAFDSEFAHQWEKQLNGLAEPVTNWANSALGEPPQHVIELLSAASKDQALADAYLDNFDDPATMWHTIASPEATAEFIQEPHARATLIRERRFLNDVSVGLAERYRAPDAVLITETGLHQGEHWHRTPLAGRSIVDISDFVQKQVSDRSILLTYRLDTDTFPLYCSSVWSQTTYGPRLINHQQSTRLEAQ